jgi:hypothetical protein
VRGRGVGGGSQISASLRLFLVFQTLLLITPHNERTAIFRETSAVGKYSNTACV